jgi:hypothetical protein
LAVPKRVDERRAVIPGDRVLHGLAQGGPREKSSEDSVEEAHV